jgi:flagellar biosynthesis protein FlhF
MRLRKYQADTIKEAVARVKAELGPDAMIIATRPIRRGFLGTGVEVTVSTDAPGDDLDLPGPAATGPTGAYASHTSHTGTSTPQALPPPPPPPAPRGHSSSHAGSHNANNSGSYAAGHSSSSPATNISDDDIERIMVPLRSELRSLKAQLRASSVSEELAALRQAVTALDAHRSRAPDATALAELADRAHIAAPSNSRVVALVGPTGAGKTTTIAKLAARAALGRRQQVALVTVDTYRVGGEEQMRIFAELIGVPLVVVRSLEGLASAIDDLAGYARVFIDTAGRSPRDGAAIDETARALAAIAEIETHLTLPAQAPPTVLDAWLRALDTVGVDRLLFTKLDEADELDALVRAPARTAKPVAWVTTGQRVPEDVEDVTAERLLSWATRGLAHREVAA